jgi:RNA polymerase sigma-70 factor (ECF subfamily)
MNESERRRLFGEWMASHRGLLYKVVQAYAFTAADREDLFQEIASQLWSSIPGFAGRAKASTFIYRVALFSAITWSRKERRHRVGRQPFEDPGLAAPIPDPRLAWLYGQIGELAPVDRSLLLLLLDGLSYREMAEVVGISESHVGVRIHRIKKRLADRAQEG